VLSFDLPTFLAAATAAAPTAGDLLLAVGCPLQVFVDGELVRLRVAGLERMTPFQTEAIVLHLLAAAPPSAAARLRQEGAANFAYSVPGVSRFRAAVFLQRGTYAVSLRTIPLSVPSFADLKLPPAMVDACKERVGIVLVNGPAGSGRTTTQAAMVNEINGARACHVVSVEDPIEFLHRHATATVNQREVGLDTPTMTQGMSDALREGAQVLIFSEPRELQQARLLLEGAETGHLVISTLRGFDTASALMRILALFPTEERSEARSRFARALRWSFTQQLLPNKHGREPVVEVWRNTRLTSRHLAEGQFDSAAFADVLRDGEGEGQVGFDRELERRVRRGDIDVDVALANSVLPQQLDLRLLDLRRGNK
jgi:twitching motility protein PilT